VTRRRRDRVRRARNMLARWQGGHSRAWLLSRRPAVLLDGARAARQFRDDRAYRDLVLGYDRWTRAERLAMGRE
jgi:hypothetical protein